MAADTASLLETIRNGLIGQYRAFQTPFGGRPLVYADYTASGRSLDFIEDQLRDCVLPYYANTHTETSFTGAQTTRLREQAREAIHSAVRGGSDHKVIFVGSGATAAINLLIDVLNLRLPRDLDDRYGLGTRIPAEDRPVVFVGPYEHHSNELPWRESIADVVRIPLSATGDIDQVALTDALAAHADRPLRIGSFSAASNVTGILSDVGGISRLLKRYGALAFWDYAAAAPYVAIDMQGSGMDAVFLSPHKFVGGPGTPGVLVANAALFANSVPARVGGGTVAFVSPDAHRYVEDVERREEGGTPAIVESIRAGLVFRLQAEVGIDSIEALECERTRNAQQRLEACGNLEVLGGAVAHRLPIFSLRFRHGEKDLHYGFVVALLNDLFGIQARGGCSCAGPYGHALLGLDRERSAAIDRQVRAGQVALRPGWVRLNFNYFIDDAEFDYLLDALVLVAEHGSRLLPAYRLDAATGTWYHRGRQGELPVDLWAMSFSADSSPPANPGKPDFAALLDEAAATLRTGPAHEHIVDALAEPAGYGLPERLRWFVSAGEVADTLLDPDKLVASP